MFRFKLFRQGYPCLNTEVRASSLESLAQVLAQAPQTCDWPATLAVFVVTSEWFSGHWNNLPEIPMYGRPSVFVPLTDPVALLAFCQEVWPEVVRVGWDYGKPGSQ